MPGFGRHTIRVDREDPGLELVEVSAAIHATQPIVVDRAMYLSTANEPFAGGIAGAGTTTVGPRWFLAEGATGSFFDMYVLIGNPSASDAPVRVTYLLEGGQNIQKLYTVHAGHRLTISVDHEDPALESAALSAIVESMDNVPIVVERTMWWPGDGNWQEGHLALGAQTTGTRGALAEGEDGGPANTQMYALIANTSAFEGAARVTLLFEDGTSAAQTVALPASSRVSVPIRLLFPDADGRRFGTTIESLGAPAAEIVIERAIYSDANGITWAAGSAALATKLP